MKKGLGTITLILVIVVLIAGIAFFGEKMKTTDASLNKILGGATTSTCTGTFSLSLSPNPAVSLATITSDVFGFSACNGKSVYIKQNSCSGTQQCACSVSASGCSCTFSAPYSEGSYNYYACVDKNADGDFSDTGESVAKTLTVKT